MKNSKVPEIEFKEISKDAEVTFKQVLGNFVEPKLNEKATFLSYEMMKGIGFESKHEVVVKNKAKVHGISCFECRSSYINFRDGKKYEVISYDRITDDYVQSLAYIEEYPDGTREFYSYKDQHFLDHWGMGEDNCGMKIHLKSEGEILSVDNKLIVKEERAGLYDLVGRYELTINNKSYETVRLVFLAAENQISDFFIDKNGKEIMHRFFIPNEGFGKSQKDQKYSKQYPNAEVIKINERECVLTTYVIHEDYL